MPSCLFKDETSNTNVMGGGGAGSWEFGSATPSLTGGTVSVDGVLLNTTTAGFFLADGIAGSSSLVRTTGTVSLPFGQGTTVDIDTSSKGDYVVLSWEVKNASVYVTSITTTKVTLLNATGPALSVNYSWI